MIDTYSKVGLLTASFKENEMNKVVKETTAFDPPQTDQFKLINAGELGMYPGWELYAVVIQDEPVSIFRHIPDPHGSYPGQTISVSDNMMASKASFLIKRPINTVIEDLRQDLTEKNTKVVDLINKLNESEGVGVKLKAQLSSEIDAVIRIKRDNEMLKKDAVALAAKVDALLHDLSTISKEIGEAKIREILGK